MDPVLIGRYLREATATPIVWGKSDCAMLAGDVWAMATGRDPMADLRGRYDTRFGYLKIAKKEGGLLRMARKRLGEEAESISDGVGLLSFKGSQVFGIRGNGVWVAPSAQGGLENISDGTVLGAWSWSQ